MNNKGLISALVIIIILGCVVYFTLPKNEKGAEQTGTNTSEQTSLGGPNTPTSQSSNEEIVDFIIDDLAKEETSAAEATIDSPASQPEASVNINTNF